MKVWKCSAESPRCGEDKDAEEEREREELQTKTGEAGGFPSGPVELKVNNLLLIPTAARDKTQNLTSNSVHLFFQHQSVSQRA